MPVMDGYTAVRKISRLGVAYPSFANPDCRSDRVRLWADDAVRLTRQAGFDLHVSKPVKRETLLKTIAKTCGNVAPVGQGLAGGLTLMNAAGWSAWIAFSPAAAEVDSELAKS